jgi:hypothetical protein
MMSHHPKIPKARHAPIHIAKLIFNQVLMVLTINPYTTRIQGQFPAKNPFYKEGFLPAPFSKIFKRPLIWPPPFVHMVE